MEEIKYCACGCGKKVLRKKSNYIRNHDKQEMIDCKCGCGQKLRKYGYEGHKKIFIVGHKTNEHRNKIIAKNKAKIGKKIEEIYGEKKAKEVKEKISKLKKGISMEERHGKEKANQIKQKLSKNNYMKNNLTGVSFEQRYGKERAKIIKEKIGENKFISKEEILKSFKGIENNKFTRSEVGY